ncbi:DUF4142 domain-containing protein [Roseisolibacter sp. H3M3-2]|uniref:DUF4142 domain-containing protein n=1 Tax=Roseisolibacter sp. H3M3-2 TaxID=3031323 RepID=UPI0023DA8264|nr:DUF4142 domain-containing protein [Roseisolibacter sp. H3M3-2]MDF1504917.1 DUF4142 domain-containing protein [Roseisolibacter sp. H3M3-2]
MRHIGKWGAGALLGATLALGACGGGNDAADDASTSGTAAGEVAPGGTAGAMGAAGDSAAMAGAGGATGDLATMSEPDVMAVVGASNAGEIATSDVAITMATDADVKAYARKMVQEHQAMQKQADQLATKLNVTPGTPARAREKTDMANQMAAQLKGLGKGQAFDRQYMDGQVQAHQQTLTELQALQNTGNAELRTLIQGAIPKVQAHLEEGQRLQQRLGGAGTATTGG